MKLNRIITLCAVAATLAFSVSSLLAQDNGGNGGNGGGQGGGQRRQRGQGGGPGGGNFDPAQMRQQMQERMMQNYQDQLGFTNDTDWDAVKPLVQKVMDARMDLGAGQMRGMFGNRQRNNNNNGDQGGNNNNNNRPRGGMFGQQSPEAEALQKAIDDNAPTSQIKDLLAKYKAVQKGKQAKLESAQDDLKKVLNTKQEAQAYLLGLVR
jgi:hypothetical protein